MISEDTRISWYDIYKHPLFGTYFKEQLLKDQELENKASFIMNELRATIHSRNIDLTELFHEYVTNKGSIMEYKQFQ
jgi:hypothetical protein